MSGWIGVDLDGTLARYDGWQGIDHVGEPIAPMVERVRLWLAKDQKVKIFTARVSAESEREAVVAAIHRWLREQGLPALEVTNVKDFGMIECWDDRAVQIIPNTGRRADGG
jgi:hypothetical protein